MPILNKKHKYRKYMLKYNKYNKNIILNYSIENNLN